LTGALATALDETAARRAALGAAQLDEARAGLRLAQGRALQPRFEASALVQVEAERAGAVEVELGYRTPLARVAARARGAPRDAGRRRPRAVGAHGRHRLAAHRRGVARRGLPLLDGPSGARRLAAAARRRPRAPGAQGRSRRRRRGARP
jgi:hypothetical protein